MEKTLGDWSEEFKLREQNNLAHVDKKWAEYKGVLEAQAEERENELRQQIAYAVSGRSILLPKLSC